MIKCHLSRIMGERRLKIAQLAEDAKLNRGTVTRLYHETAQRVDLDVLNTLCKHLNCQVSDLLEWIEDKQEDNNNSKG